MALRHAASIELNSFSEKFVVSEGGICTRFTIYDVISRVNHSCAPNLHHFIDDNNIMHCVAIRPIKRGEQLFINYLTGLDIDNTQERRMYIEETWQFNCQFNKCSTEPSIGDQEDTSYRYIKRNFNQFKNVNRLQQECVKYLQKFGHTWSISV